VYQSARVRVSRATWWQKLLGFVITIAALGVLVLLLTVGFFAGLIALGVIAVIAGVTAIARRLGGGTGPPSDQRENVRVIRRDPY
jgi:predicted lipid-binding transport protein (Tim44 family)